LPELKASSPWSESGRTPTQSTIGLRIFSSPSPSGDEANDVDGRPSDPLGVQQVPNQGTHVLPDDVEHVAEYPTRLLELTIGLESRRLDPGRLRASRTVDELRGSWRDARIVFGNMKKEFQVIVDNKRNGETSIRDELTVCRWEEAASSLETT
jgi:hypothetical protein